MIRTLPEVRQQSKQIGEALRSASKERLREVLGDGISWAEVYELPFAVSVAFAAYAFGLADRMKIIAQLPDPQEVMLREIEKEDSIEWDGGPDGEFTKADVIALVTAMQRNVLSIMVYKKSICALVAEVRQGGEEADTALLYAVRIDRSVVACPTVAQRISHAELIGDKRFFLRLRSALKGPSMKHWDGYRDLRYSLCLLRELGFDRLNDDQLEQLLVKQLKVYPDTPAARKNLRKQYSEAKKIKTL